MIRLSVNLPKKYRLDLNLVQRRGENLGGENLFPSPGEILRVKSGSRLSRIFTHIFNHKHTKKLFGLNIAAAIVISGFIPAQNNLSGAVEQNIITVTEVNTKTEKGVRYPVDTIKVTQGYRLFHPGLDLDGITGDPIYPILAGQVKAIQHSKFAYGNAVIIGHGGGLDSLYAHLSKILVKVGDDVTISTQIGKMGATGHATGDHLHLEVHINDRPVNPNLVLPKIR